MVYRAEYEVESGERIVGIELTNITKELYETTKRLKSAEKELFNKAQAKSETERVYREALAKEIVKLRAEGVQATLISDLARGNLAYLKFERDLAADMFKATVSLKEMIETQASVLQTITRYHDVI